MLTNQQSVCSMVCAHLAVQEDIHDILKDLRVALGLVGQQDELDAQEGDEDQGGPHGLHVETGLRLVSHLQLGDEHPHDVEQEEEVDLEPQFMSTFIRRLQRGCMLDLQTLFRFLVLCSWRVIHQQNHVLIILCMETQISD